LESYIEILYIIYVCEKDRNRTILTMRNIRTRFSGLVHGYPSAQILTTNLLMLVILGSFHGFNQFQDVRVIDINNIGYVVLASGLRFWLWYFP